MGYAPQQVWAMTLWEFLSCIAAHERNETERSGSDTLTDQDLADLGIEGF